MINSAISHLASQLNQFLKRSFDLNEDIVVVSNILEQDGSVSANVTNKLVVFLTNIEKDTIPFRQPANGNSGSNSGNGNSRSVVSSQPIYLNLYVMFAANFSGSNYPEALKFISYTIGFFQKQPVFDQRSTPDLDPRIEKLILDVENLSFPDLSNVWGLLSGKYLPSILYKVRMVSFDADDVAGQAPNVVETQIVTGH
jgi:hypothetical protein